MNAQSFSLFHARWKFYAQRPFLRPQYAGYLPPKYHAPGTTWRHRITDYDSRTRVGGGRPGRWGNPCRNGAPHRGIDFLAWGTGGLSPERQRPAAALA